MPEIGRHPRYLDEQILKVNARLAAEEAAPPLVSGHWHVKLSALVAS